MESFIDQLIEEMRHEDLTPTQNRAMLTLCFVQGFLKGKALDDLNSALERFFKSFP